MTIDEMGKLLSKLKLVLTRWAPKEIDRDMASIWSGVLKDYSDTQIRAAFAKAAANFSEWPAPAAIKRLCQETLKTDEQLGQEIASRIEGAIRKFGYMNSEEAEKFIGSLGWAVIRQCGGWVSVCEIESDQLPSARKQWRELGTIISQNYYALGENAPPSLPPKEHSALVKSLSLILSGKKN